LGRECFLIMQPMSPRSETLGIGARLREARQRARMSLRELGAKSGMSIGQLSKIERDKKPVSLRHFETIRKALGVSLFAMFPDAEPPYVTTRRETIARRLSELQPGKDHFAAARLAESFMGKRIEPFCFRNFREPGKLRLVAHDSEHFIFVLQGKLEVMQTENRNLPTY